MIEVVLIPDLLARPWPDVIERADGGPGVFGWWHGLAEGLTVNDVVPVPSPSQSIDRRAALIRVKELIRLRQMQRAFFEAGEREPENWGYGEGYDYIPPRGEGDSENDSKRDLWGRRMALADMAYTGYARPFRARRCTMKGRNGLRCTSSALDDQSICTYHHDSTRGRYLPKIAKGFLVYMSAQYSGILAELARKKLGIDSELSLREELALQRVLLQQALDYVETEQEINGRDTQPGDIAFIRAQIEGVATLVKQNIDAETKMAFSVREMERMNRRIVEGVMKYVEPRYQEEFMNFITGKGTEDVTGLLAARVQEEEGIEDAAAEL